MSIVGGLDIHRKQITFDYVELETGRFERGSDLSGGSGACGLLAVPLRRD